MVISGLSSSLSKCSIFAIATLTYANIGSFINNAVVEFVLTTILLHLYLHNSYLKYKKERKEFTNKQFYWVNLILQIQYFETN